MKKSVFSLRHASAALLLAGLPLAALAQTQPASQAEILRRGDLIGGRPHASMPRTAAPGRVLVTTTADPVLARYLHESIDINRVPASQLPDLYSRFIEYTRDERRQWSPQDWDEASAALSRLNVRYEAVRKELSLEDRLAVRTYQGEFRTLQGARRVKDRVGD